MNSCSESQIQHTLWNLKFLVNKANFVHNLSLVYLSISTCFGQLCAHHQEKQLFLCDTWYLLFCVDDCLVCRVESTSPPCHTHVNMLTRVWQGLEYRIDVCLVTHGTHI